MACTVRARRRNRHVHVGGWCASLTLVGATVLGAQRAPAMAGAAAARVTEAPAWAMPLGPAASPSADSMTPHRMPGSRMAYSKAYLRDWFQVADWYPESHPVMPSVVSHGRRPAVFACAYCHLANGAGRPENATLAGLPAKYIEQQVAAMRSGARSTPWHTPNKPQDMMRRVADSASAAEVREAARYFAKVPLRRPARVVEGVGIPRVKPGRGVYFLVPGGGDEPLGARLVEVAGDEERHELHDPNVEYVTYVPPGSIARGKTLATQGIPGVVQSCTTCHGPRLRGIDLVPPIAGRSPSYLLRQLLGFATGARATAAGQPMRAVAAALTLDDMISAVAYAGSLAP